VLVSFSLLQQMQFRRRDASVPGRIITDLRQPDRRPDETDRAKHIKGYRPSEAAGQPPREHEADDLSEGDAAEKPGNRARAFTLRHPAAEQFKSRGRYRCFAQSQS